MKILKLVMQLVAAPDPYYIHLRSGFILSTDDVSAVWDLDQLPDSIEINIIDEVKDSEYDDEVMFYDSCMMLSSGYRFELGDAKHYIMKRINPSYSYAICCRI